VGIKVGSTWYQLFKKNRIANYISQSIYRALTDSVYLMIVYPIFPRSRKRRSARIAVALMLVMVVLLLAAGCIRGQPAFGNTTANGTAAVNPSTLITQPVQIQCPPVFGNAPPYIIINPIGGHNLGDTFEINGTTNLGVDSKILFELWEPRLLEVPPDRNVTVIATSPYQYFSISGYVKIEKGPCGENFWSYTVNLPGNHAPWHREYSVAVSKKGESIHIVNSSIFPVNVDNTKHSAGSDVK